MGRVCRVGKVGKKVFYLFVQFVLFRPRNQKKIMLLSGWLGGGNIQYFILHLSCVPTILLMEPCWVCSSLSVRLYYIIPCFQ